MGLGINAVKLSDSRDAPASQMLLGAADFSWPGIYRLLKPRHLVSEAVEASELVEPSLCCG